MQITWFNKIRTYLSLFSVLVFTIACSNTPNNIAINLNQGQCVQLSQYSSSAQSSMASNTPLYNALVTSNPVESIETPYCMAVTIQNNNAGTNANNIQITSNGLQVTYTPIGTTTATTVSLYDPNAAGITITGESQQINNIVMFDPSNCATTTGSNVVTLPTQGGSCTFYLEILNESSPVGVAPYSIAYNYTNGNSNYTANSDVNQRTYLYGGAPNGLYFMPTSVISAATSPSTTPATWQTGLTGTPTTNVSYIVEDAYGFIFFSSLSQVYVFNANITVLIGTTLPSPVIALAVESDALYAATQDNGVWVYNNPESLGSSWVEVTDTNGKIGPSRSMRGLIAAPTISALYEVSSDNHAYGCTNLNPIAATQSCSETTLNQPNMFFPNSFAVDPSGNFYAGSVVSSSLGISPWNGLTSWGSQYVSIPELPYSGSSGPMIGGVAWSNLTGSPYVYFGLINESVESSVFQCIGTTCTPLVSNSGSGNSVYGTVNTLATDGVGNLYVAGQNLLSADWESFESAESYPNGAFILFESSAAISGTTWIPINPGAPGAPSSVNYAVVASMLTSY